jgi:hypothetical protein
MGDSSSDETNSPMIRVYDKAGNVIETHEHKGEFKEWPLFETLFLVALKGNVDGKSRSWFDWHMKTKITGLTLALCFFGAALCFADDQQMGTWKLNEAKSKLTPGTTKINMVVIEAAGDNVKVTVDGTDRDGKSMHNEWTGKFDGKDYPVTGNPDSDMRSYKKIDDRTLRGGKIQQCGTISDALAGA